MIKVIKQPTKWSCVIIDENLIDKGFELFKRMKDKERGCWLYKYSCFKGCGDYEMFTTDH